MSAPPAASKESPSPADAVGRMVVARFRDGRMVKGTTRDFLPNRPLFHVYVDGDEKARALEVTMDSLKAVFFVKDYTGESVRRDDYDFARAQGYGRKARVTFHDGEEISGFTTGYNPKAQGFFLIPADQRSNNARIYVLNQAIREFRWV
jgi:hypothetical protein